VGWTEPLSPIGIGDRSRGAVEDAGEIHHRGIRWGEPPCSLGQRTRIQLDVGTTAAGVVEARGVFTAGIVTGGVIIEAAQTEGELEISVTV